MKKRIWLLWLLFLLAALDVIGMDRLRVSRDAEILTENEPEHITEPDEQTAQPNDGIAPADIAAVVAEELQVFPIPLSITHPDYEAVFENSWMAARTFGGDRGHEGTDIMLYPGKRGLFPVLSMTDGVVEKKGWLPQGGYRLGIRSAGGIYYYYAHLYDYAPEIAEGTSVTAGELIGFAGDSGYSNIEGTVGNFAVHLHVGIYYDDAQGRETSINPYDFLVSLETAKTQMEF